MTLHFNITGKAILRMAVAVVLVLTMIQIASATTPNPGHAASEIDFNQVTKTTTATLTASETVVLADATTAAFTITLPTAASSTPRTIFYIKKIDATLANLVTIDGNGSETIDGMLSITLAQRGEAVFLQSDGTNWRIIGRRDYDLSAYKTRGSTLDQWYSSPNTGTALTTGAPAANRLIAIPLVVSKVMTIDQMAINVTTLGASSTPRIGIYADNGNNYPGVLIADAGTQSGGSTGVKTYTTNLPITLDPGLYWLAYVTNATAPTIRSFAVASMHPILGYASTLPTNAQFGWTVAFTFGALPNPFTASASALTAVPIPAIFVRASS